VDGWPVLSKGVEVEFVRVNERMCLAPARRADGALLETTATAKSGIPHDLEHFVVESAFGYQEGIWGLIARGAEFATMRVATTKPRRRPRAQNRALARGYDGWGEHLVSSVVAVYRDLKAGGWCPPAPPPRLPASNALLDPRRCLPIRVIITGEALHQAFVDLDVAERQWASLPIGGSLRRSWP
jgi:hypothetical protein